MECSGVFESSAQSPLWEPRVECHGNLFAKRTASAELVGAEAPELGRRMCALCGGTCSFFAYRCQHVHNVTCHGNDALAAVIMWKKQQRAAATDPAQLAHMVQQRHTHDMSTFNTFRRQRPANVRESSRVHTLARSSLLAPLLSAAPRTNNARRPTISSRLAGKNRTRPAPTAVPPPDACRPSRVFVVLIRVLLVRLAHRHRHPSPALMSSSTSSSTSSASCSSFPTRSVANPIPQRPVPAF